MNTTNTLAAFARFLHLVTAAAYCNAARAAAEQEIAAGAGDYVRLNDGWNSHRIAYCPNFR